MLDYMPTDAGESLALLIVIACAWAVLSHRVKTGILKGPGMGMLAVSYMALLGHDFDPEAVAFFLRLGALLLVLGVIKDGYLAELPARRADDKAKLGRRSEDQRVEADGR